MNPNFERKKNSKNKLQNLLWTLIFRASFEKHQKCDFFVLQVITQNDIFWTLKDGVIFILTFFQKSYESQYLPEQSITFASIELK